MHVKLDFHSIGVAAQSQIGEFLVRMKLSEQSMSSTVSTLVVISTLFTYSQKHHSLLEDGARPLRATPSIIECEAMVGLYHDTLSVNGR